MRTSGSPCLPLSASARPAIRGTIRCGSAELARAARAPIRFQGCTFRGPGGPPTPSDLARLQAPLLPLPLVEIATSMEQIAVATLPLLDPDLHAAIAALAALAAIVVDGHRHADPGPPKSTRCRSGDASVTTMATAPRPPRGADVSSARRRRAAAPGSRRLRRGPRRHR